MQIQILARKFLSSTFSRFSDFWDQILAHDFGLASGPLVATSRFDYLTLFSKRAGGNLGLNSFSAKIYFGRHIASGLYLFSGFHSKYTNEKSIWSVQMRDVKHMEGKSKRCPSGHPLRQQ